MSKSLSAKALMKKKEAADAREAKLIQEQARKLTELREAKRKREVELNSLIREAQKEDDKKQATSMGSQMLKVLRKNAPEFLDQYGLFKNALVIGVLVEAHAKMLEDAEAASRWVKVGEALIKRGEQTKTSDASETTAEGNEKVEEAVSSTDDVLVSDESGLPSVEDIFATGETK